MLNVCEGWWKKGESACRGFTQAHTLPPVRPAYPSLPPSSASRIVSRPALKQLWKADSYCSCPSRTINVVSAVTGGFSRSHSRLCASLGRPARQYTLTVAQQSRARLQRKQNAPTATCAKLPIALRNV